MTDTRSDVNLNNLDPQHFIFWQAPVGRTVLTGPEQRQVHLPQIPLPIKIGKLVDGPSDHAIGEGLYDYLRQFPECLHNTDYARLLQDAYGHFLADLAAHVVMLDKKQVDPAYVRRKLSYLKILRLLEPDNCGLLWQLAQGYYDLALTFTELPEVRRHLLDAMRFSQELLKYEQDHCAGLNLLSEIDLLFGDYPTAIRRFQKLLPLLDDPCTVDKISSRCASCLDVGFPDHPLVDDLERVGEAMQLYAAQNYLLARQVLEQLEEDAYFMQELKSPDFLCLLGMCRAMSGDRGGAFDSLSQALELEPEHEQARQFLDTL